MAKKDDKKPTKIPSGINKLAKYVQDNIDILYQKTYYNSPTNSKDLSRVRSGVDGAINRIISNNMDNVGVPNISSLYARLDGAQRDKNVLNKVSELFGDEKLMNSIMTTYTQNAYLKELDNEIDVICKYVPRLLEALDTRKDNVLSADHFSKDFINISEGSTITEDPEFYKRIEDIKDKYELQELIEDTYDNAAKYGEQFLYIVPYKKALARLLQNKNGATLANMNINESTILCEGEDPFKIEKPSFELDGVNKDLKIEVELNQTNMITSVVESYKVIADKLKTISESSLYTEAEKIGIDKGLGALDYQGIYDNDKTTDGLITPKTDEAKENTLKVPGCIIKKIDRSHIIPVYIEDTCLGYYYLEFKDNDEFVTSDGITDSILGVKANKTSAYIANNNAMVKDQMMKYISAQLSRFIDSKFINANQDLRREIYTILKYNDVFNTPSMDRLKVTFLPPEDVVHVYFKKDKKTNRGISDLARSLFPAKLYASLYITNALTIMTRGQDKRVYYVRQNVDTNIAKVLLNTIDQIKRSNFGIRQVENLNNILNITGKFNDYVIPTGPNGESPVQFEVMQGQNVEIKSELMNILEEMAINCTDVPIELIQARQSIDYAVQLTMTNSKFLRKVYNRQAKYQKYCSQIITKVYNCEYNEDSDLDVALPPPMFLNITNTNQIINNANEFANAIAVTMLSDSEQNDTEFKSTVIKKWVKYHLKSYIDMDMLERIKKEARMEIEAKKGKNDDQQ